MTKQELNTLHELLSKLRDERLKEIQEEQELTDDELQELIDDPYCEDLYDIDDGDNLIQGLDIVIGVVENIRGE